MRLYNLDFDIVNISENYMKVHVSSLAKGMGHTLGSALRRTLINEVEGTAVRAFHLQNKAGIPLRCDNVVEDTAVIMMTLTQLRVKRIADPATGLVNTLPFILVGKNNGKDKITFGDLKPVDPNISIEILNPDIPILHASTTLDGSNVSNIEDSKYTEVTIRVLVCDGVYFTPRSAKAIENIEPEILASVQGYSPSDIYIDCNSLYQPVEKVNFYVESASLSKEIDTLVNKLVTGITNTTSEEKEPKKKKKEEKFDSMHDVPTSLDRLKDVINDFKTGHALSDEIISTIKVLEDENAKLDIINATPVTITTTVKDLATCITDILRKTSLFTSATPVLYSEYSVEEESLDKYSETLILEVKTNGTVSPLEAFTSALKTLIMHFEELRSMCEGSRNASLDRQIDLVWKNAQTELAKQGKKTIRIDEIPNIPTELYNTLKNTTFTSVDMINDEARETILGRLDIDKVTSLISEAGITVHKE